MQADTTLYDITVSAPTSQAQQLHRLRWRYTDVPQQAIRSQVIAAQGIIVISIRLLGDEWASWTWEALRNAIVLEHLADVRMRVDPVTEFN
jgi:hypothetical protein